MVDSPEVIPIHACLSLKHSALRSLNVKFTVPIWTDSYHSYGHKVLGR